MGSRETEAMIEMIEARLITYLAQAHVHAMNDAAGLDVVLVLLGHIFPPAETTEAAEHCLRTSDAT